MLRRRISGFGILLILVVVLWQLLPSGSVALRSGALTWRSGVFAGYGPAADEAFASWRGRAIASATDFLGSDTWSQLEDPAYSIAEWGGHRAVWPEFSVALWPGSTGSLAAAASGAYDTHFAALARNLVAGGLGRAGIRLGWEFNGTWYSWSVRTAADAADYAAAWRRIVTAMRSVPGARFSFDWAPTLQSGGSDPARAYPGDVYVSVIGLDVYDWVQGPGSESPSRGWAGLVNAAYGLSWQARFAAAHHKPIAFPEWGLVSYAPNPALAGGDDPAFVRNMFSWFASHHVAFENYFDSDAATTGTFYGITTGNGRFPTATGVYRSLYGLRRRGATS